MEKAETFPYEFRFAMVMEYQNQTKVGYIEFSKKIPKGETDLFYGQKEKLFHINLDLTC